MSIEAKVMIDVPDIYDINGLAAAIESIVSRVNGVNTRVNIVEVDNPLSISPIQMSKLGESEE